MKRVVPIALSLTLLCGCSAAEPSQVTETQIQEVDYESIIASLESKLDNLETTEINDESEIEEEIEVSSIHVHDLQSTNICIPGTYTGYNDKFYCDKTFKCECGYTENIRDEISEFQYKEYLLSLKYNHYDYYGAYRFPNDHTDGKLVAVIGEISWVNYEVDNSGNYLTIIGVYLLNNNFELTSDYIVIGYPHGFGTSMGRFDEGEKIVVLGNEAGAYTYTTISNAQMTAPLIRAAYVYRGVYFSKNIQWAD